MMLDRDGVQMSLVWVKTRQVKMRLSHAKASEILRPIITSRGRNARHQQHERQPLFHSR
jgi:hypothetical protein